VGARRPSRAEYRGLLGVGLGVVVGFPWLSSRALETLPSGHGSLLVGLMPAATATWAVLRFGERLTPRGALGLGLGLFGVVRFAWLAGGGHLGAGHAWALGAVALGAMGYAEGAALSRARPGAEVIAWAAAGALPFTLPWALAEMALHRDRWAGMTSQAAVGLSYVTAVSALLGFFAWYRGLAEGGTARVSQLQLAQPLLSVLWAHLLLAEPWPPELWATSLFLVGGVTLSLRARQR
jgi:drug/metabolite transporter (DMT)-like permease